MIGKNRLSIRAFIEQRLFHQFSGRDHDLIEAFKGRPHLRRPRSRHRRRSLDGNRSRSRLRREFSAASFVRSLRQRRFRRQVRNRLRQCMGQGNEPRPLRFEISPSKRNRMKPGREISRGLLSPGIMPTPNTLVRQYSLQYWRSVL